mmetsp:Transcript_3248/g.6689  ORF Transcript_3248/g.6689 Transcript_3248/m.6689 type:complete len:888 (+) Transcript_3248:705-3368(+)
MTKEVTFSTCRVSLTERLSEGEFSRVYKASHGAQELVVKIVSTQTPVLQTKFRREKDALIACRGKETITQLLDSKLPSPDNPGCLLLEYCPRGTVKQWMQNSALTDAQITRVIKEVVDAMQHLASHDILHRNIQPENILIASSGGCKLNDFGASISKSEWNAMSATQRRDDLQFYTSAHLRAPEQFDNRPQVGSGVDMWGLGCLLYGLLFYENAFSTYNIEDQIAGRYKTPKKQVAGKWIDLLARLFEVSPTKRACASEVLAMLDTQEIPRLIEQHSSGLSSLINVFKKSTNSWIQHATQNTDTPPDAACVQKIIAKAWSKPFKIQKFYKLLMKRQIQRTIVAIKSVLLLHMYLTSGPPAVYKQDVGAPNFLILVEQSWGSKAKKDLLYSEYFAGLVRQYCHILHEKVRIQELTGLDGAWTGGEVTTLDIYRELLVYWGKCLNFAGPLLKFETDLPLLRVHIAATIYIEAYNLGVLLSKGICQMLERGIPGTESIHDQFQSLFKNTRALHESLMQRNRAFSLKELSVKAQTHINELFETSTRILHLRPSTIELPVSPATVGTREATSLEFTNLVDYETAKDLQSSQVTLPDSPAELTPVSPKKEPFWKQVDQRWLIPASDIQTKEVLGEGSSCMVYRGIYKRTSVAVKVMRAQTVSNSIMKEFEREVSALVQLRHPNIVLFMGICIERDLSIISEYCSGGSLFRLLHDRKDIELSWSQRMKILKDVARGVLYLHEMEPPLIHRDLKSLNVLLQDEIRGPRDSLIAKVTDFGVTRHLDESANMTGQMGTCHWMAPEVLASQPYSLAADVYSYGIMVWEVAARRTPYKHLNPVSIPYLVVAKDERPNVLEVEKGCPPDLVQLMQECWEKEERARPTFSTILDRLEALQV